MKTLVDLKNHIPTYPDFPKKGVNFYDITGLFRSPDVWAATVMNMTKIVEKFAPTRLFALDSKGFIFAAPVAEHLGIGFSLLRKASKLPGNVVRYSYDLEYGSDAIECRREDFDDNDRIVVIDDVLATGGTLSAGVSLLRQMNANVVGAVTVMEIGDLNGRKKIGVPFEAMLYFPH